MSNFITYKASAGSGKTYTLAVEYIKQLLLSNKDFAHRHILAVSFTKDASGEMKDRIIAELYGLAAGLDESAGFLLSLQKALAEAGKTLAEDEIQHETKRILTNILHDYSRFYVGTIDSFFQRVLRNLARELGKGSKFNIELDTVSALDRAVRAMIEKSNQNKELLNWISQYIEDKVEQGKSWNIQTELKSFANNIFNERFQEHENNLRRQLHENPRLIAEMIKTHRRLKQEFEQKMTAFSNLFFEKNPDLNDFYYKGSGVPGYFKKIKNEDYAAPNSYVSKVLNGETKKDGDSRFLALLQETEDFRANNISCYNSSALILKNIHQLALLENISEEIEEQNKERNRFMLSQTALFLSEIINNSDASFVYEKIGASIENVMIDEFQDTSRLQWKNFRSLLSEVLANHNFSLLVGDVKQSIYRWRNGDWNILNTIEEQFPVTSKSLSTNYRSEKRVVEFNNSLFTEAAKELDRRFCEENLSPTLSTGERAASFFKTAYSDVTQQVPKLEENGFVEVDFIEKNPDTNYSDEVKIAVLEKLKRLQQAGVPPQEICILTRTNRQTKEIAAFLAMRQNENEELTKGGYLTIVSNEAFQLNSSLALKIIIEALRVLNEPDNPVHSTQLSMLLDNSNLQISQFPNLPLYELILFIYRHFDLQKIENQSGYLYAFLDKLTSYLEQNPSDIQSFLNYWDDNLSEQSVPNENALQAVRAMTIHKSKGLQFHTLIVPYCDWKMAETSTFMRQNLVWCEKKEPPFDLEILPVDYDKRMSQSVFTEEYKAETQQLWMDNLNVLYVALTRAECNMFIITQKTDTFSIAGLLNQIVQNLPFGSFDTEGAKWQNGEIGKTQYARNKTKTSSENPLRSDARKENLPIPFLVEAQFISSGNRRFLQSNKSRNFIQGREAPNDIPCIKEGNVMHNLFANINTLPDIEKAVERFVFDGFLLRQQQQEYVQKVQEMIRQSGVEEWFSAKYKLFNERDILFAENGKIITRRPDRVMVSGEEVVVVDYKFGEEKASHKRQVQFYIDLLQKMNYNNVKGFLWYVNENMVVEV